MDTVHQDNTENTCSCTTLDMGRGCEFSATPEGEAEARVCEGCFKLHVTDWLKDYPDNLPGDIFEVRFKNTRRGYYQNVDNLSLAEGDIVAVEASPGHDIGIVSLTGDIVARQMRRVGFNPLNGEFKKIYRKAKPYDIEKWQEAIALEHGTMIRSRQIAAEMNLNMKIGDVEYQGDKIKAIFYYIADERVDFRELIKVFADVFHIRVEMKQIGARQEAGRIGGLGACGRELCCASWISNFMSVTTGAARAQDISLNPQKLAGQCSKLKCCMIYEYDDYMDARREFPRLNGPLQTLDGDYHFIKNDILARTMSFSTAPGSMVGLVTLPIERVVEIMKLNAKGVKPEKIDSEKTFARKEVEPGFVNAIGEDSITRFDSARKSRKKGKRSGGDKQASESDRGGRSDSALKGRREGQARQNGGQTRQEDRSRREGQPRQDGQPRQEGQSRRDERSRQEGRSPQERPPRQERQPRREDQSPNEKPSRHENQPHKDGRPAKETQPHKEGQARQNGRPKREEPSRQEGRQHNERRQHSGRPQEGNKEGNLNRSHNHNRGGQNSGGGDRSSGGKPSGSKE